MCSPKSVIKIELQWILMLSINSNETTTRYPEKYASEEHIPLSSSCNKYINDSYTSLGPTPIVNMNTNGALCEQISHKNQRLERLPYVRNSPTSCIKSVWPNSG